MDAGTVIVCGLHAEGLRVVEELLAAGAQVVMVDHRPDTALLAELNDLGVACVDADPRDARTLRGVEITSALALICVETDDLVALAVGLLARDLNPELRIVVQLSNAAVGRALKDVGVQVIDTARVAAPSVVESCLLQATRTLTIAERTYAVARVPAPGDTSLRQAFGDLAPLALIRADGHTEVAPGRDEAVRTGDAVVLIGDETELNRAGVMPTAETPMVGARAPRTASRRTSAVRAIVVGFDLRLRWAIAALLGLIATSICILLVGYQEADGTRMSVVDALYFTVETIGTVGFGDFYFRDQEVWLRMWAVILMIVGATLATVFFALLTNALISRTIARALGSRRVAELVDHVVVIGVGSVGLAVVDLLRSTGVDVVAVDTDEQNRFAGQLESAAVPLVIADATLPETLRTVGLERARAVAVMTSDDLANLETGLAVRDLLGDRWAEVPVVLRVFDHRIAQTLATTFDFRHVRSPAVLAAPWFVGAALGLDVVSTLYVGDQPLLVARMSISAGGGLDGSTMLDLGGGIRVVAVDHADGSVTTQPRRDTRVAAGDVLDLVGPYDQMLGLLRRERRWHATR